MKMADDKNVDITQKGLFTVGSHIKCRFQGEEVDGIVAAFNSANKMLMIRTASSCGKPNTSDFVLINSECMEKITVVEESSATDSLRPLDFPKIEKRRQKVTQTKKSRIRALTATVPQEARRLFLQIIKTIDEVVWDGDSIMVLNEVRIEPPYKVDNVTGDKDASVTHIKKMVDKFWKDQQPASNSNF